MLALMQAMPSCSHTAEIRMLSVGDAFERALFHALCESILASLLIG